MGGWATLEEEAELEEGEAASCYDDTNIDPDVHLSYIDEKIENVLGQFQKDFEGGVFAQTLGAKYGGYGSFLPMYQRSPPNLSHTLASPRVQSQSTSRSSCNLPAEGFSHNSIAVSEGSVIQTSVVTVANSMHGPHNLKSLSGEDSERHDFSQIVEKAHERDQPPSIKSENQPDQRKLTVRIKVVPDKGLQRNAAIYSGLGLTSPSSSTGNSPEVGHVAQLSSQEIFNESTSNIIKTLTSCSVSCDSLHSPLRDDLLNLIRSKKEMVDRKPASFLKERSGNIVESDDNSESVLRVKGVLEGNKPKSVQIDKNDLQGRFGNEVHCVDRKNSDSEPHNSMPCLPHLDVGTDRSVGSVGKAPEVVRQLEQHMPVKKRGLKDKVKEKLFACDFVKDETLKKTDIQDTAKHRESRTNSVECFSKRGLKGFEKECSVDQGEVATVKGNKLSSMREDKMDNLEARNIKPNKPLKVVSHTRDKSVKLTAKSSVSKELSAGEKNKLKRRQIKGNSSLESDGTLRSEVYTAVEDRKNALRDANKVHQSHKGLLDTNLEHMDDLTNPPEKHLFHKSKDLNHENISVKWDDEDKIGQKYDSGKSGNKVAPVSSQGDTLADNAPPSNDLMSKTEPGSSSVLITEDWVECDSCQTWRLLPPGKSADQLPEKWMCSMQDWLPRMNRCDIGEDETAQAIRALYHPPVPEAQNTLLTDANAPQAQLNVATQHQMSLGKKFQPKDTSHTSSSGLRIKNSHLMKNNQQDVIKSITFRNMNQASSEANLVSKPNLKLQKKAVKVEKSSDNLEENGHQKIRTKIKRERNSDNYDQGVTIKVKTEGHEKIKKELKRERDSDYDDHEVAKRVKIEGHMDKLYSSEDNGNPGKTQVNLSASLQKKVAPMEKQKQLDKKEKAKLQISVKRRRESLPDSVDSGSLDVKSHEATRSSTKSRKLEKSGDQFRNTKTLLVKENSGDSEFRSCKKFKASESEVKGLSKTGARDESKIENTQTRMLGSRTNIVGKNAKKTQQFKEKLASGLTMEDITALRRELGSEQFTTAATSSSSKISDSGRSRANYQEVKGSPVESVSSSPMRPSNLRKLSPTRTYGLGKDELKFGELPADRSQQRLSYIDDAFESNKSDTSMKEIVGDPSFEVPVPEIQGKGTKVKVTTVLSVRADRRAVSTGAHTSKRSSPSHVDVQGVTHRTSKIRMSNNPDPSQRRKSGVDPSARAKEINKACGSNYERVADRVSILPSDPEALQWNQSVRDKTEIDLNNQASCHKLVDNSDNPSSDECTIKAFKKDNNVSKRNSMTGMESERRGGTKSQRQPIGDCDQLEGRMNALGRGKLKACSNNDDKNGLPFDGSKSAAEIQREGLLDLRPLNSSKGGGGLHVIGSVPNSAFENSDHGSIKHPESDQCGDQNFNDHSHSKDDTTIQSASAALAKAEEYRHYGDFSKESGFECNEAYFKAALMYLLGASLVESSNSESQKGEMNQIQISGSSAKLSETCALEYEKRQDMAAAALAYKCMEVAYMRIVYFKSLCTRRVWHDLQTSLQMIPQNESPSSSASDIDNLNCQITNDKAVLRKDNASSIGSHIIAPQDHQNFIRLLDFTKDVNSAMEAARKSQNAFAAAAKMMGEQSHNNNIISSVKEVIDFGFHDLEVFVGMVQHAIGAISRRGFGGG